MDHSDQRRSRVILSYIELVVADIDKAIDDSDSREEWRLRSKGLLMHWLGALYDEGAGETKDLKSALDILRHQVNALKIMNEKLLKGPEGE